MYILQEIQTTNGATALLPAVVYTDKKQAESAYHSALAAAAVSAVTIHTVMLYDERGTVERRETYEHNT